MTFVFLIIAFISKISFAASIDVYIIAGQSNAVGGGKVNQLPSTIKTSYQNAKVWNYTNNSIEPYELGINTNLLHNWTGTFGPEAALAANIVTKNKNDFIILKYAYSGSSMHTDWNPDTGGYLYTGLMKAINDLNKKASDEKIILNYKAMFWMQGEADVAPEYSLYYPQRLSTLITNIRSKVKNNSLPIILGQVMGNRTDTTTTNFHHQQESFVEKDNYATLVPTYDLSLENDNLHYNTEGQIELGNRFFNAYINANWGDEDFSTNLKVGPNPLPANTSLNIYIDLNRFCPEMKILIYDLAGRLVIEKKYLYVAPGHYDIELNPNELNNFASAMYILSVQYQKNTGKVRRGDDHRDVFKFVFLN